MISNKFLLVRLNVTDKWFAQPHLSFVSVSQMRQEQMVKWDEPQWIAKCSIWCAKLKIKRQAELIS